MYFARNAVNKESNMPMFARAPPPNCRTRVSSSSETKASFERLLWSHAWRCCVPFYLRPVSLPPDVPVFPALIRQASKCACLAHKEETPETQCLKASDVRLRFRVRVYRVEWGRRVEVVRRGSGKLSSRTRGGGKWGSMVVRRRLQVVEVVGTEIDELGHQDTDDSCKLRSPRPPHPQTRKRLATPSAFWSKTRIKRR